MLHDRIVNTGRPIPIGGHPFRCTYRAWLGDNGAPPTVQRELTRHAFHPDQAKYLVKSIRKPTGEWQSRPSRHNGRQPIT